MANSSDPPPRELDSCLLLLSRKPRELAKLLRVALDAEELKALAKATKQRKAGRVEPEIRLAEAIAYDQRLRGQLARALDLSLQAAGAEEGSHAAQLRSWMTSDAIGDWEAAADWLASNQPEWPDPTPESNPQLLTEPVADVSAPSSPLATPVPLGEDRLHKLQDQLRDARRALASAQEELGIERKRRLLEEQERVKLAGLAEEERKRATELKQQLAQTSSASTRESDLTHDLKNAKHELHIATQKVSWLEEERDDLRQVLEDRDRFEAVANEEVPSFRDRPLIGFEQELAAQLRSRADRKLGPFRVLVVGGGPPQLRHRGKLDEYAEAVGFQAEWRMAEYQSWHRAMDSLQRDMQERFDAMIILHWNRTTFTRRAREICDKGGAKPCLTCRYEGFTALRESLQECLRELLLGESRNAD